MPHVSDVRATSHDRHDPMLVAALAADDLAGIDRDQAIALTSSCAECALLRDDLVALARASASAPPPIATRPRDFRLTPADAARLRPDGWRRLVAALSRPRSAVTRPLGMSLATLGLVGLLVANVQIPFGSTAAMPEAVGAASQAGAAPAASARDMVTADGVSDPSAGPELQGAPAAGASAPAASAAALDNRSYSFGAATGAPGGVAQPVAPNPTGGKAAATERATGGLYSLEDGDVSGPFRPLNLLFGAALVIGVGLLLVARRRGRPTV